MKAEVLIAGGGLVGAALALLLVEQGRIDAARTVILEPKPVKPPAVGTPIDLRVSAISPANQQRLARLGVWQRMDAARITAIERMAVWHESVPPDSPDVLHFDAAESGLAVLGHMVENAALQGALLAACADAGISLISASLQGLQIDADGAHARLEGQQLDAELVVGADGAVSAVRGLLHLPTESESYGQRGIVATIDTARPHRGTAYQRFLATGPLALLPLPDREHAAAVAAPGASAAPVAAARAQVSIVWSATDARAQELLDLPPEAFNAALTAASAGVLGGLSLASGRAAFPLQRLAAQRYVAPRMALVGDAAHVIHPLAGQGVNQGLEDAAALAWHLGRRPARESAGALAALRAYERERRAGNALVGAVVHGLDRLFTDAGAVTSFAARSGLALVARLPLARRTLVRQAARGSRPRG